MAPLQINSAKRYSTATSHEDRVVQLTAGDHELLAIIDGHGGTNAADRCAQQLAAEYREARAGYDPHALPTRPELQRLFERLHACCLELPCHSGACLAVAVVNSRTGCYAVANAGDALALHVTASSHFWASTSHRLQDNAQERERVHVHVAHVRGQTGDEVAVGPPRLFPGGLACSRGIGDADCPHVVCTPAICYGTLAPTHALVLASDGLWDRVTLGQIVRTTRKRRCAESLADLLGPTTSLRDDASVIVASYQTALRRRGLASRLGFSGSGSDDDLTSTRQRPPVDFDDDLHDPPLPVRTSIAVDLDDDLP